MEIVIMMESIVIVVMAVFMVKFLTDRKSATVIQRKLCENEINRLKRDNGNLQAKLEIADRYRNEYEKLCKETKNMHKKYKETMESFQRIEKEYTGYLEELKRA